MGQQVDAGSLAVRRAGAVRGRLDRSVAVLRQLVADGRFVAPEDSVGMEVELNLVDPLGRPRLMSEAVLARLGRSDFQQELAQFNIEVNLPPRPLRGRVFTGYERRLDAIVGPGAGSEVPGGRLVAVGMLPTLSADQLTGAVVCPRRDVRPATAAPSPPLTGMHLVGGDGSGLAGVPPVAGRQRP